MEQLIDHEHGLTPLLAGLVIALGLHLVLKIINLVIGTVKTLRESDGKKLDHLNSTMHETTKAIYVLNESMKSLNNRIVETDIQTAKIEVGHSRLVATVKELAGDRWGDIQKKVKEDEFIGERE